jgi:parallel beta-helix repeat protein
MTLITASASTARACKRSDFEDAIETAAQTIYVQSDGSIEPSTAPIKRDGNTYTFTDNIFAPIIVDKANIILDGAGYTLHGPFNGTQTDLWIIGEGSNETANDGSRVPWTVGIDMRAKTQGLTIRNLNIKNFSIGIWLWTSNNTVRGNAITENLVGVLLSGMDNVITENCLTNNRDGIFFGANQPGEIPTNIILSSNSFISNARHLSGCVCADFSNTAEALHTWDNGSTGNYWGDYTGIDANGDGLGDQPYVIDVLNQDRFPLIKNVAMAPTVAPKMPLELIIIVAALAAILVVAFLGKVKSKKPA